MRLVHWALLFRLLTPFSTSPLSLGRSFNNQVYPQLTAQLHAIHRITELYLSTSLSRDQPTRQDKRNFLMSLNHSVFNPGDGLCMKGLDYLVTKG